MINQENKLVLEHTIGFHDSKAIVNLAGRWDELRHYLGLTYEEWDLLGLMKWMS